MVPPGIGQPLGSGSDLGKATGFVTPALAMGVPAVVPEERVFFVVGRGRSGTTLLSRMLSGHPALSVAPEGFFVMNLRRRYQGGGFRTRGIEAFCHDLVAERRMAAWGLDTTDVAARLRGHGADLDYARACAEVYLSHAEHTEGQTPKLVGDKNPHYALFATQLVRLFPAARFVHIVRDPRDNVLSYQSVPFDLSSTGALASRWLRYHRAIMRASQWHPDRFIRIRYEDLVTDPQGQLSAVCRFLGVAFDEAMLGFAGEAPSSFYGDGSAWFDKLERPLDPGQIGKWQGKLGRQDLALVEDICGHEMRQLGYDLSGLGDEPSARGRLDAAIGTASVAAERFVFGGLPPELRTWGINAYRARTGRV